MPAIDLAFGTNIGRYQIVRKLGAGGMAEVFLARDPRLNRDVAVKVLGDALVERPGYRVFLQREARAIALLNHPHIAQVHDIVDYQDRTCFVMEYIDGETLLDRLRHGALPLDEVCRLGIQIASAIGHAHAQGILHCDLKPGNIFLTTDGEVKVVDFGLARPLSANASAGAEIGASPTLVANRAGTPDYMSPEQYFGRPLDERCDLYSLGVVLYELATAARFVSRSPSMALGGGDTTRTLLGDAALPAVLRPVIERTIAPNPADRFSSAIELQAALERIAGASDWWGHAARTTTAAVSPIAAAPRWRGLVVRSLIWLVAAAAGITALGLLNTIVFNTVLDRRDVAPEGVGDWFIWGLRSLVAPGVLATTLLIALGLATSVVRYICRAWLPGLTTRAAGAIHRSGLTHPAVLGQTVAAAGIVAVGVIVWRFNALIAGFGASDGISTGDLDRFAIWSSSQFLEHRYYRMSLTTVVVLMTVAIYHVLQQRRRFGHAGERASIATAIAVLAVAVLLLDHPYRLLQQDNRFPMVEIDSKPCYRLGDRDGEALVFCPSSPVPRNRRFPKDGLTELGCLGSVFDAAPRCGTPR